MFPPDDFLDLAAGHGSFCAGIVQQIVPEADIAVYKELDSDGLAHEVRIARTLVGAVRDCLKADQHVIVNLSFGTETADDERPVALGIALEIIDEESRKAGLETLVVAAAGNFGHDRPCYPAAFPSVTAVAALTQGLLPAEWSSRGAWGGRLDHRRRSAFYVRSRDRASEHGLPLRRVPEKRMGLVEWNLVRRPTGRRGDRQDRNR